MTSTHTRISSLPGNKSKNQVYLGLLKLPIIFVCIVIYIIGYIPVNGHFTEKNQILSAAFVNFVPGEKLSEQLGNGFLDAQKINDSRNEVRLYKGLYLTDNEIILTTNTLRLPYEDPWSN